ncbi:MAG: hypothetical protein AAF390_09145 [Pseudomonadota bacterium]
MAAYLLCSILLVCLLSAVSVAFPDYREAIFEEDRAVEWATTAIFAVTGIYGIVAYRRASEKNVVLLTVAGVGLLGTLDELSFGERILQFEAPRIMGVKFDSLHDLLLVARKLIQSISFEYQYVIALGIALLICVVALIALRAVLRRGWTLGPGILLLLPVFAVILVVFAQMIDVDLNFIPHKVLKPLYVEEALELGAGLLLFGYVRLADSA